jgi:hypothetical protein
MASTVNIGKKVTFIKDGAFGCAVDCVNFNKIEQMVNGVSVLNYTGIAKPSKFNKYLSQLTALGFSDCTTIWNQSAGFDGVNSDVISFNIELKRTA